MCLLRRLGLWLAGADCAVICLLCSYTTQCLQVRAGYLGAVLGLSIYSQQLLNSTARISHCLLLAGPSRMPRRRLGAGQLISSSS